MAALGLSVEQRAPRPDDTWRTSVEPFRNNFVGSSTKQGLWLLLAAVCFLLLIACANVANLLLARGSARQRELAMVTPQFYETLGIRILRGRAALGAARARVRHDVLREGMTTALIGTILGATGAWFIGLAMSGMIHGVETFDPIAFVIVAGALLGSALVACLVPARRAASVDPIVALRQD
jgi:ABC-type lipoprotein release transport system permease subunit